MSEWISVDYRLPPDFQPCLIYLQGKEKCEDSCAVVTEEGWFWWIDGVCGIVEGHVTHWIPLPEPPEV